MASDRPNQTLADYVAIAISPVLIMGLVGSLVFFLLEVLYPDKGEYKDRLQWILFFFVFGAVLVGRVSLTQGIAGRAGLYGLVLAGLTWLGMQIYVDYPKDAAMVAFAPLINLFLVGVVWWCAHELTLDCTDVHEEMEVNGEGLLQATGLEKPAGDADEAAKDEKKEEKSPGALLGWWERYQRFREEKKKKRVLGAWLIYFSLAALPLFGLGEALIPAEDAGRRQFAFWLMGAYVGCGLGLLLTTCFLGLRRYLRQRRLQMPAAMTAAWMTAGGGLILALLVVGALLPRPRPEYSLFTLSSGDAGKKSASDFAGKGGSSGQGEGNRTGNQPKDKADPSAADKNGQATGKDKGEPSQEKDKGGSAGQKDKDGSGKGQDKDKGSSDKDKGDDSNRPKGNDAADPNRPKSDPNSQKQPQKDGPRDQKAQQNAQKSNQQSDSQGTAQPRSSWDWTSLLATVATVLKWIVFVLLILAVIFFLMREGLKFLAQFTDWAHNLLNALRNLWAGLFRGGTKAEGASEEADEAERRAPPQPFSSYDNPFRDGSAGRRPIKEVVRYTFAALQAWGANTASNGGRKKRRWSSPPGSARSSPPWRRTPAVSPACTPVRCTITAPCRRPRRSRCGGSGSGWKRRRNSRCRLDLRWYNGDRSRKAAGTRRIPGDGALVPKLLFGNALRETPFRVRSLNGTRSRASPTCVPKQSLGTRGWTEWKGWRGKPPGREEFLATLRPCVRYSAPCTSYTVGVAANPRPG